MTSSLFPVYQPPSEKGSALKEKNLLPRSKFFPFRVDPIFRREYNNFDRNVSPESITISHKYSKSVYIFQEVPCVSKNPATA